jgi:HK97 family phage major capsid protein
MNEKRLKEIKDRKTEIRSLLEDTSKEVNMEEINQELDNLNKEQSEIEARNKVALQLRNNEIEADKETKVSADEEDDEEVEVMTKEERKSKMSKEVRSFLKYMMSGGKETRGVTLQNGQAVVPEELDNEIITEMREVSDVMNFINLKNVKGTLRVGNISAIGANKDKDGDSIEAKGGVTGDVTFGSYRTSAKIELGVGLDAESLDAFKEIIVSELALALAIEIESQVLNGTGTNEAKGLFVEELPAAQKMTVKVTDFCHTSLTTLKGLIRQAYGKRASFLINTKTFHSLIEGMVGTDKHPIYNSDSELLLKKPVILSDEAPENKILYGNGKRYWYNYNMAPQIASSDQEKFSEGLIVHRALAFGDGHVMDKKAFAVLTIDTTAAASSNTEVKG